MEQQDIDSELSTTGAQELLKSTAAAHLAYIGRDGTARVIPVGFFWTGDQVVIATATTSPKVTALSARPDVACPSTQAIHPARREHTRYAGRRASRSSTG